MDESWDIPMGLTIPRRRSTEEARRRDWEGGDVSDPEYFRDVFGGPPRTVLLQRFSRKLSGGRASRAESICDTEDGRVAAAAAGGPRFSMPRAPARVRTDVGFYDDIFGSADRRSKLVSRSQSKSSSSPVLNSGELSLPVGDDIAISSSAANFRATSNPTGRLPNCSPASTSSIGAPTNRGNRLHALNHPCPLPLSCDIDFAGQPEAAINKLQQHLTTSFKPSFCHYEKKFVSGGDASENIASSSMISSAFLKSKRGVRSQTHGHYPSFSEREVEKRAVEVEAAKIPCFFESDATAGKTTGGAVAVDEAIAWVKEKFSNRVTNGHEA